METAKGRKIAVVIAVLIVSLLGFRLTQRMSDIQVRRDTFPVDAMQYMRTNGVNGRVVVTYDWAQYTIAAFCLDDQLTSNETPSRVAFDGRFRTCYPQELVDMHFDLLFSEGHGTERHRSPDSPPCDPSRVLEHGQPDVVLLRRKGERSETHMKTQTDRWTLMYQDSLAQVWGRKSVFDDPSSPRYVAARQITDQTYSNYVSWPALPRAPKENYADKREEENTSDQFANTRN